jgi:methylated-DNA-[protein]-cysteine S-methyltransferase
MKKTGYCLFETPIGWCGIAWSMDTHSARTPAVTLLQLPEATARLTEARIARSTGARRSDTPPRIARIIRKLCKHLQGKAQDFQDVPVNLEGIGPFARQVYAAARKIPAGRTMTYGELANALGRPGAPRAAGQALGKNPVALIIPCHRILAAGGKLGGFSAHGGAATKARILTIEGAD